MSEIQGHEGEELGQGVMYDSLAPPHGRATKCTSKYLRTVRLRSLLTWKPSAPIDHVVNISLMEEL